MRRRNPATRAVATGLTAAVALSLAVTAQQAAAAEEGPADIVSTPPGESDHDHGLPDLDTRTGSAAPSSAQRSSAQRSTETGRASGAKSVTWNRFGAPASYVLDGTSPVARGLAKDPETAARDFLAGERAAFGLTSDQLEDVELVGTNRIGDATVVLLRQTFGGVSAGLDGMVAVAVQNGSVRYVSSTFTPDAAAPAAAKVSEKDAVAVAARSVGADAGSLVSQRTEEVAVPVPGKDPRRAFRVEMVVDAETAYSIHVDAVTGKVIARENLVDADSDNPRWKVFTGTPLTDRSSTDTRSTFCWVAAEGCDEVVASPASPKAWDVDPSTDISTFTTNGNNALTYEQWRTTPGLTATPKADRNYVYDWTNVWQTSKCDPAAYSSPTRNDIDAATANLFAMHNRMHDWSYRLGFTESAWNLQRDNYGKGGTGGDPEVGRAQSGAQVGLRNNANQLTLGDGGTVYSNMYMWQPVAGSFYAPCVDGSFDMSVIGHEYGHAISNRMAGGPVQGLSGLQAGGMGESWSDLMAMEYLQENGYAPLGGEATPMGAYVTGNPQQGIRNYNMGQSPLNYSNVGYDLTGPQVHADGEIWSATNNDIRAAFIDRYGLGDAATQKACADGERAAAQCPGNRRWIQLVFDSWLLMPSGAVSMVDARDRMLAADLLRFGGANQDLLWNAFAARGLGQGATSAGSGDTQPVPSFASAYAKDATLRFSPTDEEGRPVVGAKLYVGEYTARSRPVADTDPATALGDTFSIAPGERTYTAWAQGHGQVRVTLTAKPNQTRNLPVKLRDNLASAARGATVTGEGVNLGKLVDDDEGTTATTVDRPTAAQKAFTVDLAGGRQVVRRVQVSSLPEPGVVGRFQALRQFQVLACDARGRVDCSRDADYRPVWTSPADAFPAGVPRPTAPALKMRSFDIPQTAATHLRFVAVANQCQGGPAYAGEQDNDPANATDCATNYSGAEKVGISEVQVFRR